MWQLLRGVSDLYGKNVLTTDGRKLGKDYRKKKKLLRLKKDARKRFRTSRK